MMHHVNKAKKLALILLIDFKKAFDSIDLSFMETVLKTLGFGKYIREWIRLFFSGREAYTCWNGYSGCGRGWDESPRIFRRSLWSVATKSFGLPSELCLVDARPHYSPSAFPSTGAYFF